MAGRVKKGCQDRKKIDEDEEQEQQEGEEVEEGKEAVEVAHGAMNGTPTFNNDCIAIERVCWAVFGLCLVSPVFKVPGTFR